jgi:hypothetical protein
MPALPPEASLHANAGRFVPGGVAGVTGGGEITGPVRTEEAVSGETAAVGEVVVVHPSSTKLKAARAVARTGE